MDYKTLETLEQEFFDAEKAYRNAIRAHFLNILLPRGGEFGQSVTKEFDVDNDPIVWTMDDGEVHTFCSVTIGGYDGEIYTDFYFETESEGGGSEYDFNDLDTTLLKSLLQSLIDSNN